MAKKEANARLHEQQRQATTKSMFLASSSDTITVEVALRRAFMIAACIALFGGITTQAAAASGATQMLASSPSTSTHDTAVGSTAKLVQVVIGSLPSLWYSSSK